MNEEKMYRRYVADSLYFSGQQKTIAVRYNDLIKTAPVDDRSGDDIAQDIIRRHNLKVLS